MRRRPVLVWNEGYGRYVPMKRTEDKMVGDERIEVWAAGDSVMVNASDETDSAIVHLTVDEASHLLYDLTAAINQARA